MTTRPDEARGQAGSGGTGKQTSPKSDIAQQSAQAIRNSPPRRGPQQTTTSVVPAGAAALARSA